MSELKDDHLIPKSGIADEVWADDHQFASTVTDPTAAVRVVSKASSALGDALGQTLRSQRAELGDIGADRP